MKEKPVMLVFGGPNGSGKSTVTEQFGVEDIKYINADEIVKEKNISNLEAAQEAGRLRNEAIQKGESFAMETVMSMPDKIDLMKEAKEKGFEVRLIYVTTYDSALNVDRVEKRVQDGGHDVPKDKTIARYERSMKLLPEALKVADWADVYNNSLDEPILILEKTKEQEIKIYPQDPPSKWNKDKLNDLKSKVLEPSEAAKNNVLGYKKQAEEILKNVNEKYKGDFIKTLKDLQSGKKIPGIEKNEKNKTLSVSPKKSKGMEM